MQSELGREIGNGVVGQVGVGAREPGVAGTRVKIRVKPAENTIVALQIASVFGRVLEDLRLCLDEKAHRVMPSMLPQAGVKAAVERTGLGMPTPPDIIRQFVEPVDARRQGVEDCHEAKYFHRQDPLSSFFVSW